MRRGRAAAPHGSAPGRTRSFGDVGSMSGFPESGRACTRPRADPGISPVSFRGHRLGFTRDWHCHSLGLWARATQVGLSPIWKTKGAASRSRPEIVGAAPECPGLAEPLRRSHVAFTSDVAAARRRRGTTTIKLVTPDVRAPSRSWSSTFLAVFDETKKGPGLRPGPGVRLTEGPIRSPSHPFRRRRPAAWPAPASSAPRRPWPRW
jgi:hypothetical protein